MWSKLRSEELRDVPLHWQCSCKFMRIWRRWNIMCASFMIGRLRFLVEVSALTYAVYVHLFSRLCCACCLQTASGQVIATVHLSAVFLFWASRHGRTLVACQNHPVCFRHTFSHSLSLFYAIYSSSLVIQSAVDTFQIPAWFSQSPVSQSNHKSFRNVRARVLDSITVHYD